MIQNPLYIYELIDPISNDIRYVGKTKNPKSRLKSHLTLNNLKQNTPKNNWIKKLLHLNLKPKMRIICITTEQYINETEILKIKEYRKQNIQLTNSTDGGEGLNNPSIETRSKISRSKKGKNLGRIVSQETRQKISLAQIGKSRVKWSLERKLKQSKPVIGTNILTNNSIEFIGAVEASKQLKLNQSHITSCCKNHYGFKSHGGYIWRYKN